MDPHQAGEAQSERTPIWHYVPHYIIFAIAVHERHDPRVLPVCNVITRQHAGGARSGRRSNFATWPHTVEKMRDNAGGKIAETSIAVRQGVRRGAAAEQLRFQIGCKLRGDASIVSNGTMHS